MEINAKLIKIVTGIGTAIGLITGVFVVDDRWNNDKVVAELKSMENRIVDEFRSEVGINRAALISLFQRDLDDIEFEISKLEASGHEVPRYMIERSKSTKRLLKDLLKNETIVEDTD